jgi:anti-sigma factor RsiW
MDHLRFKSNQTAATYVADGLDPKTQEAFELHLLTCPECVSEVESWRAIKHSLVRDAGAKVGDTAPEQTRVLPRGAGTGQGGPPDRARSYVPAKRSSLTTARFAASLAAVALAGTVAGWSLRSAQAPWSDSEALAFFTLPPVTRGPSDCTALHLDGRTRVIALRVPGAAPEQQLVAVDSAGRDLGSDSYSVRTQGDGSWLVRLDAAALLRQDIRFEARSADGTVDPRGCLLSPASR